MKWKNAKKISWHWHFKPVIKFVIWEICPYRWPQNSLAPPPRNKTNSRKGKKKKNPSSANYKALHDFLQSTWAMVSTWMGDHSSVEVDAVVKNTVKLRSGETGPPIKKLLRQKKKKIFIKMFFVCINFQLRLTFYSVFEQFIQYRLCLVFVQLMFNVHICTV